MCKARSVFVSAAVAIATLSCDLARAANTNTLACGKPTQSGEITIYIDYITAVIPPDSNKFVITPGQVGTTIKGITAGMSDEAKCKIIQEQLAQAIGDAPVMATVFHNILTIQPNTQNVSSGIKDVRMYDETGEPRAFIAVPEPGSPGAVQQTPVANPAAVPASGVYSVAVFGNNSFANASVNASGLTAGAILSALDTQLNAQGFNFNVVATDGISQKKIGLQTAPLSGPVFVAANGNLSQIASYTLLTTVSLSPAMNNADSIVGPANASAITSSSQICITNNGNYAHQWSFVPFSVESTAAFFAEAIGITTPPGQTCVTAPPSSLSPSNYFVTVCSEIGSQCQPGSNSTATYAFTLSPSLTVACPNPFTFQLNTPFTGFVTATGGTTPYLFSITAGGLPNGVSLDPTSGGFSGTTATPGSGSVMFQVTDGLGGTAATGCAWTAN